MGRFFTVLGARVVGVAASVIVAKAAERGLTLDPVEVGGIMLGAYSVSHRIVSRWSNPGDAAKSRIADAEKSASNYGGNVTVNPGFHSYKRD